MIFRGSAIAEITYIVREDEFNQRLLL